MEEYNPTGKEKWYDVASGVAYLDNSKFDLSYSGDKPEQPMALAGQRLMAGREIVGQQQRVAEMAEMNGYFAERKLNIPYPNRVADEESVMAWTRMAPKSLDEVFDGAYN